MYITNVFIYIAIDLNPMGVNIRGIASKYSPTADTSTLEKALIHQPIEL